MAKSKNYKQPEIKKSNGEISKVWAKKKMSNPRTAASTKKKLNFYLNFNK